jgi:hypothetical protein
MLGPAFEAHISRRARERTIMALYRCVAYGIYTSGRAWSFRQHFSSTATLATVQSDWAAQTAAAWTDGTHGLQTLYPTTTVFDKARTYLLAFTLGPPVKLIATSAAENAFSHAGTSSADGLPDQDAVVVSLRTAGVGVNNRGRTFLPAVTEDIVIGDIIGSTQATRVTTAMTALRAGMAAAGHTQVILNDQATLHDPTPGTTKPVTSCETDRVMRTQRRRVRKLAAQYV